MIIGDLLYTNYNIACHKYYNKLYAIAMSNKISYEMYRVAIAIAVIIYPGGDKIS